MSVPTTLAEKVYAVLRGDDNGEGPISTAEKRPAHVELSLFEADVLNWGVYFGVGYGIACGESPYEDQASRAGRALDAADQVWPRMSEWNKRDDGEVAQAARELALVARRFYERGIRDGDRLDVALSNLESLVGAEVRRR